MLKIEKNQDGNYDVYTPYSQDFVEKVKRLGCRWNATKKCWVATDARLEHVREAMRDVYGEDDLVAGEKVDVVIRYDQEACELRAPVTAFGRIIAAAWGRDTGARVGEDAAFTEGFPKSGGSRANWRTIVPAGTVVKVFGVPVEALKNVPDEVTVVSVQGNAQKRDELLQERERLKARIEEINQELARLFGEDKTNA